MKKRSQKLSLHRETIVHLENLAERKLARVAGGEVTSCGFECSCPDEFGAYAGRVIA